MAERIVPQNLPPPARRPSAGPPHWAAWLALGCIVAAVIGVVGWRIRQSTPDQGARDVAVPAPVAVGKALPDASPPASPTTLREPPPGKPSAEPIQASTLPSPASPTPFPAEETAMDPQLEDRDRADAALTTYIERRRDLDAAAADVWAGDEVKGIDRNVQQADEAYASNRFADAAEGYERAARSAEALIGRQDGALASLLQRGAAALTEARGSEADRVFSAALAIDPGNQTALAGVRRAATIERTAALLQSGRGHADAGRWELALVDFEEAYRLDPLHPQAAQEARRARERLQDEAFQEAMSAALEALGNGEFDSARTRVLQARALRPDSTEVLDALFRITEAERAARLEELRQRAEQAEAAEDWAGAHQLYRQALAIDANVAFGREGAERCAAIQRLLEQMQHFLDQPERLEAAEARAAANLLVSDAEGMSAGAPSLADRAGRLAELLAAAETKVPVELVSDGQTRVDVYQVGRFAPFQRRRLDLLPGTYTIVGYRPGFRDVRLTLSVRPGMESAGATVICRERI